MDQVLWTITFLTTGLGETDGCADGTVFFFAKAAHVTNKNKCTIKN